MADPQQRSTYRQVFADPVFRVLFATRILTVAAGTLRMLALSVLVFDTTGSPLLTAVAFGIGFVPQVIGGTLLGALADRLPARAVIVAGCVLDGCVALVLALGGLPVAASLGLVALAAVAAPVFQGAGNRVIAESLTGDRYVLGRSLSSVSAAGAQLLGLAAGGVAVAALGGIRALLLSAAAQFVAAAANRLGLPALGAAAPAGQAVARQSWQVTVRLWRDRDLRALFWVQWLPPACLTGAEGLIVAYVAQRDYPHAATGLLLGSVPAGMLVGNLVVGRFVAPATRERLVAVLLCVLGAPVAVAALALPLMVVAALLFVSGTGFAYALGVQRAFLDALDPAVRGQGFALQFTGLMTMQGVGPLVAGAWAQLTSPAAGMAAAGVGALLLGVWWALRDRSRARRAAKSLLPVDLG
jgi:predicted MFS family arabinose efflux permease